MSAVAEKSTKKLDLKNANHAVLRMVVIDQEHEQHDEAVKEYARRYVEGAIEYRENNRGRGCGWPAISPVTMIGQPFHDGAKPDKMAGLYDRGIWNNEFQSLCHSIVERLPIRQRVALMIQQRKTNPRRGISEKDRNSDVWCREFAEILEQLKLYLRMLNFDAEEIAQVRFNDAQQMRKSAHQGITELILVVRNRVVDAGGI